MVKRYDCDVCYDVGMTAHVSGDWVSYSDYAELIKERDALAAENAELKSSRAVLSENALEACNVIASAGFRNEAIMRGLYASTWNWNKYPKPIATFVDEALREVKTPATDDFLAEVRAQGVEMFALMFAEEAIKSNNITTGWRAKASRAASEYAEALREDAAQLRQGAAL